MAIRTPNIHQRVWLEAGESGSRNRYISTVLELDSTDVAVALPSVKAQWVLLDCGQPVDIIYTLSDGVYRMPCVVTGRRIEPPAQLRMEVAGDVIRIQRRDYVRIEISVPVKYRRRLSAAAETGRLRVAPTFGAARTRDLSGGGALLVMPEEVSAGDILDIEFVLGTTTYRMDAKVVRVAMVDVDGTAERQCGVHFLELTDGVRDRIIGFLLNEQVRRRKEGRK